MRYMLETPWGRFTEDGSRFEFDAQKFATATGYSIEQVRLLGWVANGNAARELGHLSESAGVLVAAATNAA